LCSVVTQLTAGRTLAKTGAEGVYTALLLDQGISIALKVADGASRASQVAIIELIYKFGGLTDGELAELKKQALPMVKNWMGKTVGEFRCQIPY
jgi:L-asparaginase II